MSSSGLSIDPEIKNTNIIYFGANTLGQGSNSGQIWLISLKDGMSKLLVDSPNFRTRGIAFLSDAFHYIFIGDSSVWLSDISGTSPKEFNSADTFIDQFRPYTPIWNLLADINKIPSATDWRGGIIHSPDNKASALWKPRATAFILRDENGKEVKVMETGLLDSVDGTWSSDGKRFIFSYYQDTGDYYGQVFSVNADGSDLHPITQRYLGARLETPHQSSDGKKIAFVQNIVLNRYLTILDLNTGKEKLFKVSPSWTEPVLEQNDIVWSPDSKWILYVSAYEHNGIEALNLETGDIFCVTINSLNAAIQVMDWR
jgi:hypothetical protein